MTVLTERNATQPPDAGESTGIIAKLLSATASRDGDLDGVVGEFGVARVGRVLLDEILFRACLDDVPLSDGENASVHVVLEHGGERFSATVSPRHVHVTDEPDPAGNGAGSLPAPVVTQDLTEVATALYGPAELVTSVTRKIRWPGPGVVFPTPQRPNLPRAYYDVARRVVQVMERSEQVGLTELAVRYGTDKWSAMHQYTRNYERHLGPLRDRRLNILEIGIGGFDDPARGGKSLRSWKHYFPRALVYGIDILDKHLVDEPRLTTFRADQSNAAEVTEAAEKWGPFDLILDDGSHISEHVIKTFGTLFARHLRPGGLYIIEDLCTSYWPEVFQGDDTDLADPRYTIGFLKALVDGLHHEELLRPDAREPRPTDTTVSGLHLYHNVAVIEKGSNTEGSVVADVFRARREREGR
ncbi:class I SAM-dependent methyltransferase [Amycolatopsis sp. NPDC021455]|uniref:class I SAM-dependent methyltransferase n=1 Tax=Amycolatopsis sp. NPDC021455 TaxID=3154901 RepID=UPI0033D5439D